MIDDARSVYGFAKLTSTENNIGQQTINPSDDEISMTDFETVYDTLTSKFNGDSF
jgi:hypothetical protein